MLDNFTLGTLQRYFLLCISGPGLYTFDSHLAHSLQTSPQQRVSHNKYPADQRTSLQPIATSTDTTTEHSVLVPKLRAESPGRQGCCESHRPCRMPRAVLNPALPELNLVFTL